MIKDKIEMFCKLAYEYESVMLRKSGAADKLLHKMALLSKEILSTDDGLENMSALVASNNIFIAGWSCMNILSHGTPSMHNKKKFIDRLKLLGKTVGPFAIYISFFLAANGYAKYGEVNKGVWRVVRGAEKPNPQRFPEPFFEWDWRSFPGM